MKEKQKTIIRTIDYIEKHLSEDIKLDDVAKDAGYSKYHLNRIFSEITGQTIHKYIRERRLSESARVLSSSDMNIIEIAQDAGYTSQQAYTQAFRQLFHYTPQVYRELNYYPTDNKIRMRRSIRNRSRQVVCRSYKEVMAA